jgi:hypothetical protein
MHCRALGAFERSSAGTLAQKMDVITSILEVNAEPPPATLP